MRSGLLPFIGLMKFQNKAEMAILQAKVKEPALAKNADWR